MTASPAPRDLIDDIATRLGELAEMPDAPRAEAWVSSLVGQIEELAVADGRRVEELIDDLLGAASAADVQLLSEVLARSPSPVDHRRGGTSPMPEWLGEIGRSRCVDALVLTAVDSTTVVLVYGETDRHVLCIEADAAGDLLDIQVGPADLLGDIDAVGSVAQVEQLPTEQAMQRARAILGRPSPQEPTDGVVHNRFLAAWRLTVPVPVEGRVAAGPGREPDPEAEAVARQVLDSALGPAVSAQPDAIRATALRVRSSPAFDDEVLMAAAGLDELPDDDEELLVALAAAYIVAADLRHHRGVEQQLILDLEWADWLGAIIGAVRAGPGAEVTPSVLVEWINRCPEITSSIPADDAGDVAEAFALTLHAWQRSGALDEDGRVSELGLWLLPGAARWAWR